MTITSETLSAYLDDELTSHENKDVEAKLKTDANLARELDVMMAINKQVKTSFEDSLEKDIPPKLLAVIENAQPQPAANTNIKPPTSRRQMVASIAALGLLSVGVGTGYFVGNQSSVPAPAAGGWLADVADYHRIYSTQKRHLVEVGAQEVDHIETWLTNTVGVPILVPDLSEFDLTFQGARLLVAAGKPVSQLIFTDANEDVVALCAIQSGNALDGLNLVTIDSFDLHHWSDGNAQYVVVGTKGRSDLSAIARAV